MYKKVAGDFTVKTWNEEGNLAVPYLNASSSGKTIESNQKQVQDITIEPL